jgi:hypothetical protein
VLEGVEGQHAAACDMGRYDDCHTRVVCTFCMPLQVRNSVVPIPVHLDLAAPLRPQLDAACDEAHRQGHNVRALLFTRWGKGPGYHATWFDRGALVVDWCLLS